MQVRMTYIECKFVKERLGNERWEFHGRFQGVLILPLSFQNNVDGSFSFIFVTLKNWETSRSFPNKVFNMKNHFNWLTEKNSNIVKNNTDIQQILTVKHLIYY